MNSRLRQLWQSHGQSIRLGIAVTVIILIFVPIQGINFNVFAGSNGHNNDKDNGHEGDTDGKKCKMLYECKKVKQKNEGKASASGFGSRATNIQSNRLDDKSSLSCISGSSNDKSCNNKSIQSKNSINGAQQNDAHKIASPTSTVTASGHNTDKHSDKRVPTGLGTTRIHQGCQGTQCSKQAGDNIHIKDQIGTQSK